ncbi:TonB family C-terminal domain-containing protein [Ekhidna lutea]|uniref:TonB family C-terminal domain-containing protein n=1 Tax=Ekhidna lutea TaxID=447679 RepID=A0A239FJ82_EKHLU|nr:energy transducer TonB [Ekhidna lutea]SNS56845.1 TonB family C-terminal domain-containing protein [Ekhidna lutea]
MSKDRNHSEQFERYLKGQMSPDEAHAFERKLLDDPFAQEAIEGFESQGLEPLADLEKLRARVTTRQKAIFPFIRVAAAVALLIVGSLTVYIVINQFENETLSLENENPEEVIQQGPSPDTILLKERKSDNTDSQIPDKTSENEALDLREKNHDKQNAYLDLKSLETTQPENNNDHQQAPDLAPKTTGTPTIEVSEDLDEVVMEPLNPENNLQGRVAGVEIKESDISILDVQELQENIKQKEPLDEQKVSVARSAKSTALSQNENKEAESDPVQFKTFSYNEPTIRGIVTDEYGEPLPGVNVVIKGTTTGTVTDLDGSFELPKTEDMVLIFSFVGFSMEEIKVGERTQLDVALGGSTELQEVVVTGYDGQGNNSTYKKARPVNGMRSFKKYIEEELIYPETARNNEIEGFVILDVSISPSGVIEDISVRKSLGYGCDLEAIRLVQEGPEWMPSEKGGLSVADNVRVRVRFKL